MLIWTRRLNGVLLHNLLERRIIPRLASLRITHHGSVFFDSFTPYGRSGMRARSGGLTASRTRPSLTTLGSIRGSRAQRLCERLF